MSQATPSPSVPQDRRRNDRAPFAGDLRCEASGVTFTTRVAELSEDGLRMEAPPELPLRAPVRLTLELPRRDGRLSRCDLCGQVIRRQGPLVGVAFERPLPRHMLELRDYVWRTRRRGAART